MKRIIALVLCLAMIATGCSTSNVQVKDNTDINVFAENEEATKNDEFPLEFMGMNDEALLSYVEDFVYSETVNNLDSEEYVVEEVRAVYISKEYLEEVAFNSQPNMYFGYTIEELNKYFQGSRYIFTLGESGETNVQELQEITDTDNETILKNVAIGTGVILVCVTVSVVSAGVGAPAAVTAIFTASAKTATTFAIESGTFGAVSAGIVRGYETGDMNEAFNAAALAGSEAFKWGAITGAVSGRGKETFLLRDGANGGLTLSEVAIIQRESKYPIEVIMKFNSMEQYKICKSAGLTSKIVNGRAALVRNIDLNYKDKNGKTNLQLMLDGLGPLDPTGQKYELHHIGQNKDSPLAILTMAEHRQNGNSSVWHILTDGFDCPSQQSDWLNIKASFWETYVKILSGQ